MLVRPLPGASYHTLETILHSFADVNPDAVGRLNSAYGHSEKQGFTSASEENTRLPAPNLPTTTRRRGGPPVLLTLILLFSMAFVASAFWEYTPSPFPLSHLPDRHALMADHLTSAFLSRPYRTLLNENYDGALKLLEQRLKCAREGCPQANLRDYLFRTYPLTDLSLNRTDVTPSAVVLHWQGTDRGLNPVLVTNSDAILDASTPTGHTQASLDGSSSCGEEEIEYMEELADIHSAVGMLTAIDALLRSGYRPSRTLVFSLILGEASCDASNVSEHLYATYGELDFGTELDTPLFICKNGRFEALGRFIGMISRVMVVSHPPSATARQTEAKSSNEGEHRTARCGRILIH
ncbi:hypothetical protein F5148DRAFT_1240857 [Russula earlei]|uniref:Uncharacterized protein n=1 Tax=Russula earlei TaxID=71964 RepID=A0ACC0TVN8_9AGAM|nr:hypothetical protein F5148DRAFT_1240857 [Russula earlei]